MAINASDKFNSPSSSSATSEQKERALEIYEEKKEILLKTLSELVQSSSISIALKKETSNLFRETNKKTTAKHKINVKNFNKVLYIDKDEKIAVVEGMTPYEELVKETLKYGLMPTVVPELKSITIGGALAGVAIESSSFRYGLVHETVVEYELLLGNGEIIVCTPDNEHKELFYAFPNTYGSLGYALKIKVKLVPVKDFVKLTHVHFTNAKDYFEWLKKCCLENRESNSPISFIDGVIFNQDNYYATLGEFTDSAPLTSNYKYLDIYYQSISKNRTDYLTTEDYIWRWDTDWFWCSKNFFMENKLCRFLFGKFLLKSTAFWKLRHFFNTNSIAKLFVDLCKGKTESVIQDIQVPIDKAVEFLEFFQKKIGITPIWVCPVIAYDPNVQYPFYRMQPNTLYINFGFWDAIPSNKIDGYYNRLIEQKVQQLGGNKSLYSKVYYRPEEFWKIYDYELYHQLKFKYDPKGNLKDFYQKLRA